MIEFEIVRNKDPEDEKRSQDTRKIPEVQPRLQEVEMEKPRPVPIKQVPTKKNYLH